MAGWGAEEEEEEEGRIERGREGDNVKEGGDLASRHLQYLTGCDELSPFS